MRLQDCADAQIVAVAYVIRIVLTCASTIIYLKPEVTLHHIVYALIVGHFSMDVGIFLSFSGHALSVEVQTNHRCKTAKITGGRVFRTG